MLKAWGCGALPGLLWMWKEWNAWAAPMAVAVAISWFAVWFFRKMSHQPVPNPTRLWVMQGVVALLCSLPALWFET
jgi:hypothetical protein